MEILIAIVRFFYLFSFNGLRPGTKGTKKRVEPDRVSSGELIGFFIRIYRT
jgi:hypothetical protein